MKSLRYLVLAGALALGAQGMAQKIPEFQRSFAINTKVEPIVTVNGPVSWSGKTYTVHNSPAREIYELRGYANMSIRVFGFIGVQRFHLGAITRIDGDNIESIIYVNNRTGETLSEYDKALARKEGIDIEGICSLWHEKYTPTSIINLETGEERARNGATEFQTIYFNMPQGDTLINVHFCGDDYPINISRRGDVIEADLTIPDPENPGERKKLQRPLFKISAHADRYGLPERMVAGVEVGKTFYPEATYDSKKKWVEKK